MTRHLRADGGARAGRTCPCLTDPYIIWVYSVDYLLNQQGIYGDEKEAQKLYEQARGELKFNVRIE